MRRERGPENRLSKREQITQLSGIGFVVGLFAFVAGGHTSLGLPPSVSISVLVGGVICCLVSAVVGLRYGDFERYHEDYDEETGRVGGDSPIAQLQFLVDPPEDRPPSEPDDLFSDADPTYRSTMPTDHAQRFASTEEYYARFRPGYCEEAFDLLAERFALDDEARVLDLGCGAGQLTVPMAQRAGAVVAMDPNEAMLAKAEERVEAAGRSNVEFVVGSDADLPNHIDDLRPLRLTTMGRSFHWTNQERTLEHLFEATEPGGGVALMTDQEWLTRGREPWQAAVYEIAAEYLDDLPECVDPEEIEYDDPWAKKLAAFGFEDTQTDEFRFEREWTVDEVVGYVFSLSYCSPQKFGDDMAAFEANVRERLVEFGEPLTAPAVVEVISGKR
ncbi:class I SAM-dependent methyltransferase [Haloarchaeobius sp. DFWS5]|uniref:class I SAM-dependent methyltransferase n=1 Tax=Haloarchaeobius sp. DFWS5 TaxID=3446114 RepID=UPI003EB904C6